MYLMKPNDPKDPCFFFGVWTLFCAGAPTFKNLDQIILQIFKVGDIPGWVLEWFSKIVVPQNGWFIMEIPIKIDDLGVPLFSETPIYYLGNL